MSDPLTFVEVAASLSCAERLIEIERLHSELTACQEQLQAAQKSVTCQIYGHIIGLKYCENCNLPEEAARRLVQGFRAGLEGDDLLSAARSPQTENCLQIASLQEALLKAEAERDAAVRDAGRWRLARNILMHEDITRAYSEFNSSAISDVESNSTDAAIDAAIKAEGEKHD